MLRFLVWCVGPSNLICPLLLFFGGAWLDEGLGDGRVLDGENLVLVLFGLGLGVLLTPSFSLIFHFLLNVRETQVVSLFD